MGGGQKQEGGTRVGLRRALPPVKFFNIIKRYFPPPFGQPNTIKPTMKKYTFGAIPKKRHQFHSIHPQFHPQFTPLYTLFQLPGLTPPHRLKLKATTTYKNDR